MPIVATTPSLAPTVTCWDCDAPNPPGRVFCTECGTFIAVGSKVFSGRPTPDEPWRDRSEVAPVTPGAMSLGAYSVAMRRQAQRRRVLLGTVSVALVAIVGLASLYVATSPRDEGRSAPQPAALAATTAEPTAEPTVAARRNMGPAVGAVDLSEIELEPLPEPALSEDTADVADAPATEPEVEAQLPVDVEPGVEPDARIEPEPPSEPELQVEPEAQVEPEVTVEPEPRSEPGLPVEPPEVQPPAERAAPEVGGDVVWRNGWVCGGELTLEESLLRAWTISRASFLPGNGYERVVLQLQRIGPGSGQPASLSAEAYPRTKVARRVPGVRQPSLGRTAIALQFSDGVKTDLTLRGYRPSGLATIKEFSAYPAGPRGSRVLISTTTDEGCFRVRTPAWSGSSRTQKGQIVIDVKS